MDALYLRLLRLSMPFDKKIGKFLCKIPAMWAISSPVKSVRPATLGTIPCLLCCCNCSKTRPSRGEENSSGFSPSVSAIMAASLRHWARTISSAMAERTLS